MDKIHLKAPGNWINDPNGFIYYKGKYHLFYQHFPYAPVWGTMHWGHAVSEDLVNWEHKGIALYPTKYEDQNGCFSGSAIEHEGKMFLYYTGVHYHQPNPENIHLCMMDDFESAQMMIHSEDGFHFNNLEDKKVILPALEDPGTGDRTHTRDPKVWRGKDAWYMMLGTMAEEKKGKLLFLKSEDLYHWQLANSTKSSHDLGWMWECPDYFETEGGEVLMLSAMGILKEGEKEQNQVICMPVKFEEETCEMKLAESFQFMDYGLDLYAPQSNLDAEGRRVLVAWARMPKAVNGKWNGMFCIPRVVERKGSHIYFRVHPNIEKQFTRQIADVKEAAPQGYRVSLDLEDGESINIGGHQILRKGNQILTDRSEVYEADEKSRTQFATPEVKEGFHLDIYVDENLIEVFVNNGEYVISNVVYGLKKELAAEISGNVELRTLE